MHAISRRRKLALRYGEHWEIGNQFDLSFGGMYILYPHLEGGGGPQKGDEAREVARIL